MDLSILPFNHSHWSINDIALYSVPRVYLSAQQTANTTTDLCGISTITCPGA